MQYDYKGFTVRRALPTGGKAGKGCNRTSSIFVSRTRNLGNGNFEVIYKLFRYEVASHASYIVALEKAHSFIDLTVENENRSADHDQSSDR